MMLTLIFIVLLLLFNKIFGGDDFLELSELQSQSVDGSEQVTQTQDVPF
jgi:hypothetical protein